MRKVKKIFFLSSKLTRKNEHTYLQSKTTKFFLLFFFLLFPFYFFLFSCNTTEPNNNKVISLSLEDVSCTEAWLKLETQNLSLPASVSLLQNRSVEQTFSLSKPDTTIYIDSLLPNKTYTFQVSSTRLPIGMIENPALSNEIQAHTLDTTTHNFTWQTYTFGGEPGAHGPSNIWDIAIIDKDNIWAVGAIYLNDSTGKPDPQVYNLARWNGVKWNLQKVPYYYQGQPFFHPIQSVFAFNSNNIWFCGNGIIRWDGLKFIEVSIPTVVWGPYQMNKIWGISSNDLYFVGNGGSIAHYQNGEWSKIESGTDIRLTDIYSTPDGKNIWACGWDDITGRKIILEISENKVKTIYNSDFNFTLVRGKINSLWSSGSEFVVAGGSIFRLSIYNKNEPKLEYIPTEYGYKEFDAGGFIWKIRGSSKNNFYIAGDYGILWHFNGISWHKFNELYNESFDRRFFGIDAKNDIVAAVGNLGTKAWIAKGKR